MARLGEDGWILPDDPRDGSFRQMGEDLFEVRFERVIARPTEKVWAALTVPERLAAWLGAPADLDLRVGGRYVVWFPENENDGVEGRVTAYDPPRLLAYDWCGTGGNTNIRWELTPEGDRCRLVFHQTGLNAWWLLGGSAGWGGFLDDLEAVASDLPLASAPHEDEVARYRAEFGPFIPGWNVRPTLRHNEPDGFVTEAANGAYDLRFTRRYMLPIEKVWAALTEPARLADWLALAKIDLRVGGEVELSWPSTPYAERHVILELDPPRRMVWGSTDPASPGSVIRWELFEEDPDFMGVRLVLTQTLLPPNHVLGVGTGWHVHLGELPEAALRADPLPWSSERERARAGREKIELEPRYRARLPEEVARALTAS